MKYAAALIAAVGANAMVYSVPANSTTAAEPVYVTETVSSYTTFCPAGTTEMGGKTYTFTEATTITITDCPGGCVVTYPVVPTSEVVCHDCPKPTEAVPTSEPAVPTYAPPAPPAPPAVNTTAVVVPSPTGGEGVPPTSPPSAGAGIVGISGLVAFLGLAAAL